LTRDELKARIEAIEESYEFFLAYAAQGLASDQASRSGGQLREFLDRMDRALDGLAAGFRAHVGAEGLEPAVEYQAVIATLEEDARRSRAAIRLVSGQESVSSQLIDNLNATIHIRALLTDLFLLDEVLG
jgi:hypothetical protein